MCQLCSVTSVSGAEPYVKTQGVQRYYTVNNSSQSFSCGAEIKVGFLLWLHLSVLSRRLRQQRRGRRDWINSENRKNNISLAHHLSDRRLQTERRKGRGCRKNLGLSANLSLALCSSILVHLLIWPCDGLGNRDLQPLETNDVDREGQQLTDGRATLLRCWGLCCITGADMKHLDSLGFRRFSLPVSKTVCCLCSRISKLLTAKSSFAR